MRGSWVLFPVVAISVACLLASGYFAVGNLLFMSAATTADGKVVSNLEQWKKGRNTWWRSYRVSVEFTDNHGVLRQVESEENYHSPTPVGTEVPVYYLPEDAATAARIGGSFLWTRALGAAIAGTAGLVFFGSFLLVSWRLGRRRK